jgi:nitrate/nitrite-specific signal transduction histidine kinase
VQVALLAETPEDAVASSGGNERLMVEVRDWGCGFSREERENESGHVGLQSMAERARLLDGEYDLITRPDEGTSVRAVFPSLPPERDAEDTSEVENDRVTGIA